MAAPAAGRPRAAQPGRRRLLRPLVERLLTAGVRAWATLYHWDLPQTIEDAGGWPARDTAARFADYAAAVHDRLQDRIAHRTTLNEPWCSAFLGYASGDHAPGRRDDAAAVRAAHHLLLGHGLAVEAMRAQERGGGRFGLTLNLYPVTPAGEAPGDAEAARRIDGLANRIFLDPVLRGRYPADVLEDLRGVAGAEHIQDGDEECIAAPLDFLGVNYYTRHVVRAGAAPPGPSPWVGCRDVEFASRGRPVTAMGWEIDADGLYEVLARLRDEYPRLPLFVTENGAAFDDVPGPDGTVDDQDRIAFLDGHFRAAHRAVVDGADLRGYFVWSLLDNFEWAHGYGKRFGLVHVDYATLERTPKASARWLREVVHRNGLPPATL